MLKKNKTRIQGAEGMKIKMINYYSSSMYVDIPPLNHSHPPLKLRGGEGGVMSEGGKGEL